MAATPDWLRAFGPLTLRAEHAGVTVYRAQGGFLKVFTDDRGAREAAALRAGLPLRTPALLAEAEGPDGQRALLLEDVRDQGRAPRRMPVDKLPQAAELLAQLHESALGDSVSAPDAAAWTRWWARQAGDEALSPALREALSGALPIGDALCHRDLHPSNWIFREADPVGLLDWSSCGRADPECDLAGLAFAAGGDPALLPLILARWAARSGRTPDPARAYLLLWLLTERAALDKDEPAELQARAEALAKGWTAQPPLHGAQRSARALPKPHDHSAPWIRAPGTEGAPDLAALLSAALGQRPSEVEVFSGHSCNDVARVQLAEGPRVAKIYNKPVPPWLFELEGYLAEALKGSGAAVLAPLPLPGGGALFRVGPRPGALYPFVGDERLGSTPEGIDRLAGALAALHALGPLNERFPNLRGPSPDLFTGRLNLSGLDEALSAQARARLRAAFDALRALDGDLNPLDLPQALTHGGLHRDHAGWSPERGVVIFDLEKLRRGPRLLDVAQSAYMSGYRNNDEALSPPLIVRFILRYHQAQPLLAEERRLLLPCLLSGFFHDLNAMATEGFDVAARARHARVLLEVVNNRANLEGALERYLVRP